MADVLIHIHTGPDDPTKATLGLVVATAALKNRRDTIVFLAGDTARLLDPKIIPSVERTGTGRLKDHLAVLTENEC